MFALNVSDIRRQHQTLEAKQIKLQFRRVLKNSCTFMTKSLLIRKFAAQSLKVQVQQNECFLWNFLNFLDKLIFIKFVNRRKERFNLILYLIQFNGTISRNDKITRDRSTRGKFRQLLLLLTNCYIHIETDGKDFDICVHNLSCYMARVGLVKRGMISFRMT